jgi:dihydropteroate synthase
MGVVNVTPDSFSDGGRFFDPAAAIAHGLTLAAAGADLLDVGGESTRPGARPVPAAEELHRVLPVVQGLAARTAVPLSVDTAKSAVAAAALAAGASVVNDVTALRGDPAMAGVIARAGAAVILMHMQGSPRTMQRRPRYRAVVAEVAAFLRQAARRAQAAGIRRDRILLDPGIGFGKTAAHNLALLRALPALRRLGYPLVVGVSRKSFIGAVTGAAVQDRLPGTLACLSAARREGVEVVRVHDVAACAQFFQMLKAIEET